MLENRWVKDKPRRRAQPGPGGLTRAALAPCVTLDARLRSLFNFFDKDG